ncbi:amidohydrolase [Streptomyces sp. NPDC000348]|uniref:amidohydrolase family protein n=1 Tax=Streptomyces sp. NPDC000348 TaxID=3364538 RepID=UPI0036C907CE
MTGRDTSPGSTASTEDAQWRHRRDLLPEGDPLVVALEELAGRPRAHTFRGVGLIDAATGEVGPRCDLEVVDGAIAGWSPASPGEGEGAVCDWYVTPGFVDAHAHVSSAADLVGLLTHGVTAYRQMWGEPAHLYSAGVRQARHAVLPRPWVTAGIVDGPGSHVPHAATLVDGERSVRRVVEDVLAFGFDAIKVYDDVPRPVFDELVRQAGRTGIPVVGHAPESVPLDVAYRTMRSTEHLYGIVPNVFRLPPAERWDALAAALEPHRGERPAVVEGAEGHFVCPTLVTWRARSGERRFTRPSKAALQVVTPSRRRTWQAAAREALRLAPAEAHRRGALVDRLGGLVRALAEAGARPLVGTDCGNPFVVAGPSYHKEIAELARAGFDFASLLRAATVDAYDVMGWDGKPGTGQTDLVFYRRPPDGDAGRLARPDGVLVDGVFLDGEDLDRLWALRLRAAGLDATAWRRGDIDPPVTAGSSHKTDEPDKENADAG